jgi:aspartyl-tRNA(Asn)/glutamyl-tRNA(Gln) amidotransferase subunit C
LPRDLTLSYNDFMKIDVTHVAKLANLTLTPKEKDMFEKQLSDILSYIEKLKKVDTRTTEITSQVTGLKNITRKDQANPSFTQEKAVMNTKSEHNGFFKVEAILEE